MAVPKRYVLLLLCVVTCGLALRLANFFLVRGNNPIFDLPIVDAQEYVNNARYYLNQSIWGPPGSYFHPPLYSYFVAGALLVTGGSLDGLRILQILLDVFSILLVFAIARRIFGTATGLLAAIFYAFFIPSIQYSLEILPPTLAIFLLLVTLYCCLRSVEARTPATWRAGSALTMGLLIVNLVNFLLSLPVLLVWLVRHQSSLLTRVRSLLLFGLVAMLPAGAVTLRNVLHANETVVVAYNGGINFFIGNNARMEETVALRPGVEYDRLVMVPYETAPIKNFAEQSRYWYDAAWHFIRTRPFAWLVVMLKKVLLFFNANELPRNFDATFFASYSRLRFSPVVRPNLVLPLALAALIMLAFERSGTASRRSAPLLAGIVGSYALSIILFFVAGRYRLPLGPLYCILAAYFVTGLVGAARTVFSRQGRRWLIGILAALVLAPLTNIKYFPHSYPYAIRPSETMSQLGHALTQAGRYEQAHKLFEETSALPTDAGTYLLHYYHASYHYQVGDTTEALRLFRKTIELKPDHYRAFNDLGFVFKMKGELDSALAYLNHSITLAPAFTLAYLNLADCYIAQQDWHRVIGVLESYYRRCPSPSPVISIALGAFYMDVFRDWTKAARHLDLALRYPQGYETAPETYQRLGFCYYYLDDVRRAKRVWSRGLKKFPQYEPLKTNLQMLDY